MFLNGIKPDYALIGQKHVPEMLGLIYSSAFWFVEVSVSKYLIFSVL